MHHFIYIDHLFTNIQGYNTEHIFFLQVYDHNGGHILSRIAGTLLIDSRRIVFYCVHNHDGVQCNVKYFHDFEAKVNFTVEKNNEFPEEEQRYSSTLSLTSALHGDGWSTPRPGHFTSSNDPIPIVQRQGGPQGRSSKVRNISLPPGFDPRTVQPVVSRYTD